MSDRPTGPAGDGAATAAGRAAPPRVVAIVPTLDVRSPRIEALLASMHELDGHEHVDLHVVVNTMSGPTRRAAQPTLVPDHSPGTPVRPLVGASILETGLNLGFAGSIAFAAGRADFTHLWLLQDDLRLEAACLVALLRALDSDPGLGAVNPTVVDDTRVVLRRSTGGMLDVEGRIARYSPQRDVPLERYVPEDGLDFVMSRALLVRADAWHRVGGTDASFFPVGWTDVDLCTRLRDDGWRVGSSRDALIHHAKGASTPSALAVATFRRNGALHRARRAGATEPPAVHPEISRELLATVARSASALAFELADDVSIRSATFMLLVRARARMRRLVGRIRRTLRIR